MTDGLEALQQAEAEALGRVIETRLDDDDHDDALIAFAIAVRATERARAAALVEAAQRFKAANEALTRLHEREAVDATNTDAEWAGLVADAWFEHDRARDALYAALAAYQGGASA